eukprot:1492994-Alexandrium_andersonii.AAC.1
MRADLLEFTSALGFVNWSNLNKPCFCCNATGANMHDYPPFDAPTWSMTDPSTYNQLVQHRVVTKAFDAPGLALLRSKLRFDHRRDGFVGLALLEDVPQLGLRRGLRLMEAGPVVDLHRLQDIQAPATLHFFDCQAEKMLNFVSPLFNITGFSVACLRLDVMHIIDLGLLQWLIGTVFWRLLLNNSFGDAGAIHAEGRLLHNLFMLRRAMRVYYRANPQLTRIHRLTLKMLSARGKPRLKAKAAETRHLLPLAQALCAKYPSRLGERGALLRGAVDRVAKFLEVMRREPRRMTPGGLASLQQHMATFLTFWKSFGGHLYYKHHMAWHLAKDAGVAGNPRFYHTYPDEGENRVV